MTTKITKRNSVIVFAVIAVIIGGVLVGLEGCENPAESGLALGGLGEQSVNTGPNGGGDDPAPPRPSITLYGDGDLTTSLNGTTLTWKKSTAPLDLTAVITDAPAGTQAQVKWTISSPVNNAVEFDDYVEGNSVAPDDIVTIQWGTDFRTLTDKVTVTAALEGYPEVTGSFTIIREPILVESIAISPNPASVVKDKKTTLTVTVLPTDADNQTVTWSSFNTIAATVNSATGEVTGISGGDSTITATAADGSGIKGTCDVSVKNR